jgi:hypothetical protein
MLTFRVGSTHGTSMMTGAINTKQIAGTQGFFSWPLMSFSSPYLL